jgi:hypothetical protein
LNGKPTRSRHAHRHDLAADYRPVGATGCTTTPRDDRVIIHCPACGTELDALFQKSF